LQTITRKKALFAGSRSGGRTCPRGRRTAKMNDVDPHA
jgi:hypothetical protein